MRRGVAGGPVFGASIGAGRGAGRRGRGRDARQPLELDLPERKIVLGKGGATIKSIGEQSRKEIAEIVGQPVHLFLFVKVRDGWGDDPERYREMGLDFPKE